jgi:hypothetical protein
VLLVLLNAALHVFALFLFGFVLSCTFMRALPTLLWLPFATATLFLLPLALAAGVALLLLGALLAWIALLMLLAIRLVGLHARLLAFLLLVHSQSPDLQ